MGSWGESPVDNDSAADWFSDLMEKTKLPQHIEKALRSDYYPEVRAAAWLLQKIGQTYVYDIDDIDDHLNLAIERLRFIRDDDKWISGWNEPKRIRYELDEQIRTLEKMVK